MTDYIEEQLNEVEALASIYPEEFELEETEPFHKFRILVKSEDYDEEDENNAGAALFLYITYTPSYPDEIPLFEAEPVCNLEEEDLGSLTEALLDQCTENLGMVMIFTLVSFAQEWINTKLEMDRRKLEEEEKRQKRAIEEIERKKFEGTRVTVESFMNWKKEFDSKRVIDKCKEKIEDKSKKLTGRELFTQDMTLNESDLSFFTEGDEVAVDESLFQDLEDLDLDVDLEDEDFDPDEDD